MKKIWLLMIPILIIGIIQAQKIDEQKDTRTTPRTIVNEADTPVRLHTDRKSIMTNDLEAEIHDIKVEHTTKVRIGDQGLRSKELHPETSTVQLKSMKDIRPDIRSSNNDTPLPQEKRAIPVPKGKTWHKPKENLYIKGEMLIQLKNEARGRVNIQVKDGTATFGIPALDIINAQYSVNDISRVLDELPPKAEEFGLDLIFLMKVPVNLDLESVSEEYRKLEDVKEVSPHYIPFKHDTDAPPRTMPDDPFYDWSDSIVKGPECWAIPETGDISIILSILDIERLYETHADLDGNYLGMKGGIVGINDHGTMCASVACAELNNAVGMSGLAGGWNTTQGVLWTGYVFTSAADNITAITWSVTTAGARVLSESIGYGGNPAGLESSFQWAWDAGAISFASAGNDAGNPEPGWPAYYGIVMAVGGCDADGKLWDWGNGTGSNIGEWVDILGPGDAQYCCDATGYTGDYGGTSFATPAAAAAAALMLSDNSSLTPAQIRDRLIRAADYNEHKSPEYTGLMGAGIVDLYESVESYNVNVSVNEMLDVPASVGGYTAVYPKAVVQNRGVNPASFIVVIEARQLSVEYADTVQVTALPCNNEYEQHAEVVEFDQWIVENGLYDLKVWTVLAGDLNNENDTLTMTVTASAAGGTDTLIVDSGIYSGNGANGSTGWCEAVQLPIAQPCSVVAILYWPYKTDTTINWRLWEDDGSGSSPGTLVRNGTSDPDVSATWYRVDLPTKYYVTGGYLYAGWEDVSSPFYYNGYDDNLDDYNWWYDGSSWVLDNYFTGDFMIRLVVEVPGKNNHDVGAYEIIEPQLHVIPDQPYIPQCVSKNFGKNTESFPSYFRIDSLGTQIYSQSVSVTNLPPDVRDTLTFPSWIPNWPSGTYNAEFYTDLTGDEDEGNDSIFIDILCSATDTLYHDAGVFKYIAGDSVYLGVRYTVERPVDITGIQYYMYKKAEGNRSPSVSTVANTLFVWDEGADPGTELHSGEQTPPNTITTGDYDWYTYSLGTPVAHSAGDFWVGIWQPGFVGEGSGGGAGDSTEQYVMLDSDTDVYRSKLSYDKTSWSLLNVDAMVRAIVEYQGSIGSHDVMTKEITEPGTIVSTLYDYPIKADVKNIGANTETFDVVARITESGGPQVYQQTVGVTSLQPGVVQALTFPDWQPAKAYDYYDLEVYTTLGGDVNLNNDTIYQDSIFSTPNEIIWYDNGVATWYWGDPDYRYTAQRFTPEAAGWCIGCWVAMQSDVSPWTDCTVFVWDDDDGWQGGGLPDPTALRLSGPVGFDPGGTGGYWFYISFPPISVDTFSDFFIGVWNAEPPHILMDDTTSVWRAFCAEDRTSDDWQPISYDLLLEAVMRYDYGVSPKPAYVYAQKNAAKDSIILYWEPVTQDILDDPTDIEWYEIYSNADPSYIPTGGDWLDSPSDTFLRELIPAENRHYLNYAVSVYLQVADKSNMGYALQKAVNENAGATSDRNWVSIPWHSEYSTVSDLTDDLSPAGVPLVKITNLQDDQVYRSWIWDPDFLEWYGTDFAITSGRAYEMVAVQDGTILLVGSNDPDGLISLNENAGATSDRNWVSIPYNAVYSTVSDITDEYSPAGDPLVKITYLQDDQVYRSWIWDPDFLEWYGTDFVITPGRGYEFVVISDAQWNPTEHTNSTLREMLARRRERKSNIEVVVGELCESDRIPIWTLTKDGYVLATQKTRKLYRDAGISHIVHGHLSIEGCDNIAFTAYRPERPYDVLTENMIGCGIVRNNELGALWFDVGNFLSPWQAGEEIILIVEALRQGIGYFTVLSFKLDQGMDIQELGEITLMNIPEPRAGKGTVSWNMIDNDHVIGYSVYQGDRRMNEQVIIANEFSASDDAILKPVIKGGYETVFGSHGSRLSMTPISYAFTIYPNPFAKQTRVDYAIPEPTSVEVKIYDVTGKLVKTLMNKKLEPGYYQIDWHGKDNIGRKVAAGVYFIRMNAQGFESQQKVIFVR